MSADWLDLWPPAGNVIKQLASLHVIRSVARPGGYPQRHHATTAVLVVTGIARRETVASYVESIGPKLGITVAKQGGK